MIDDRQYQGGATEGGDGEARTAPDPVGLRRHAMDLLARREHSRFELIEKLRRYCGRAQAARSADGPMPAADPSATETLIERTVDRLQEDGLQSDARYAEVLIRSRFNRGQGPLRIRSDLRQRGLDAAAVETLLDAYTDTWPDLAQQVVSRRFGDEAAADRREWAKRARFLAGRGFPEGLVAKVLGPLP